MRLCLNASPTGDKSEHKPPEDGGGALPSHACRSEAKRRNRATRTAAPRLPMLASILLIACAVLQLPLLARGKPNFKP